MDKISLKITRKIDGLTIKEYLKSMHVGRGKIEEIRVNKSAYLNNEQVNLETPLKEGDILTFLIKEKIDVIPSKEQHLDVLYEDEHILIVNKPSGYLIHNDGVGDTPTLCSLVARYYYEHKIFRPVRYIHRLDVDTTGIVLFAKDFLSEARLHADMERHLIRREYQGIATNKFKHLEGKIDSPIGKDRHNSKKMRVSRSGQSAVTHYRVLKEYKGLSLVNFVLETGRTHQIRVHMASINHPLLGDELYGKKSEKISRVALHSSKITFFHPISGEIINILCILPSDLCAIIEKGGRSYEK